MHTKVAAAPEKPANPKETAFPAISAKWVSPHTLAKRWGLCRETVLRLVRVGALPAFRINARVVRISEADAERFIARHRVQNVATDGD